MLVYNIKLNFIKKNSDPKFLHLNRTKSKLKFCCFGENMNFLLESKHCLQSSRSSYRKLVRFWFASGQVAIIASQTRDFIHEKNNHNRSPLARRHVGFGVRVWKPLAQPAVNMAVNVWLRMFFYGLHGFFDEILFTSLFNLVESNFLDWTFRGHSSLWSFFMYGFGSFVIEQLYLRWRDKWYLPMPVRGVLYVLWVYVWELSCGLVLRHFNACPWDYSNRQWNVSGLVTLQYFPAWFIASLWQELVAGYLLTLSKDTGDTERKDS